jgi:HlyD family secretion protein
MKAAVDAAKLELLSAKQALDAVYRDADKVRAAALVRLAEAHKALDDATRRREYRNYRNGSECTINSARADYILAKDYLDKAKEAYSYYQDLSDEISIRRARSQRSPRLRKRMIKPWPT